MSAKIEGENIMVGVVKRYICDACKKEVCVEEGTDLPEWSRTEIGDLCPSCFRAWENYKQTFVDQMRKVNNEKLI